LAFFIKVLIQISKKYQSS